MTLCSKYVGDFFKCTIFVGYGGVIQLYRCYTIYGVLRVKTITKRDNLCFIRVAGEFPIVDDGLVQHSLGSGG